MKTFTDLKPKDFVYLVNTKTGASKFTSVDQTFTPIGNFFTVDCFYNCRFRLIDGKCLTKDNEDLCIRLIDEESNKAHAEYHERKEQEDRENELKRLAKIEELERQHKEKLDRANAWVNSLTKEQQEYIEFLIDEAQANVEIYADSTCIH